MRYFSVTLAIIVLSILAGCTSDTTIEAMKDIEFLYYRMSITTDYVVSDKLDIVDGRISDKIVSLYKRPSSLTEFSDNIIISQDKLTPNASLEDYVQASIGGIVNTWGKYTSRSFDIGSMTCKGKNIPSITNIFSIYRTPPDSTPETLYFVQYFVHHNGQVVIVSSSTNKEENINSIVSSINTLSCL